ncbi:MAG: hypothetical protein JSS02_10765, partial [Planctomycetes bacterium]|nr:hypothetical protein [Planctomycetota bacterium]
MQAFESAADGLSLSAPLMTVPAITVKAVPNVFGFEATKVVFASRLGSDELDVRDLGDIESGILSTILVFGFDQIFNLLIAVAVVLDGSQR